ncbi:MAG: rhodanese-like domain-containing protein [Chromatiales bacterium]|jgi:rhodanese-related sulfurtransferase
MDIRKTLAALAAASVLLAASAASAYDDVTPTLAAGMVANDNAYILDVRTDSEWTWVGHPGYNDRIPDGQYLLGRVVNISYMIEKSDSMVVNPSFVTDVLDQFGDDRSVKLISMCRSGGRSVLAALALEAAGFTQVYNMTTGFEGGKDSYGYRTVSGWKVDQLPYIFGGEGAYAD